MGRLLLILFIAFLISSCAQSGCPGGMCPPDRYNASSKKANKRGMKSTANYSSNYKKFDRNRKSQTDWSRGSGTSRFGFNKNFESDNIAGQRDSRKSNYTRLENKPFKQGKLKSSSNFESDKFAGQKDTRKTNSTQLENSPFSRAKLKKARNFESDKYAGRSERSNGNYSMLENSPFGNNKSVAYKYTHLLGSKKIKNKSRKGHEEGLFARQVNNYQETKTYHVKRKKKGTDKVGVKKLD